MTETLKSLLEQLHHADHNVRSRAALNLGQMTHKRALNALLDALRVEADLNVQEDITWSLVRQREAALDPLITLLEDANPVVRFRAAHTLGKIGDVRAADALVEALADSDVSVVAKASFALGQIGDANAVPALVDLLGHADREVQTTAVTVLEHFGQAAVPSLTRALHDERWMVREQAVNILGLTGDRNVVPVLVRTLRDEQWQVRLAAVTALGYLGGETAREALQATISDPEPRVRILTQEMMKRMKG